MSLPGRPQGECRSAEPEATPVIAAPGPPARRYRIRPFLIA
jgi:hypothetical protein